MAALLIILGAIVLLFIGYVFYGSYLAKQWGLDPLKKTPALEIKDGVDYVSAKPAVLMGHHFSSIAETVCFLLLSKQYPAGSACRAKYFASFSSYLLVLLP